MKNKIETLVYGLDALDKAVELLLSQKQACSVFTFTGPLGAGKTTLIRAFLKSCGVKGVITSPTFTYVNMYTGNGHENYYHFDLYRISSLDEFIEQGFDEYMYQPGSWALIEWPEVVLPLLNARVCEAKLDYYDSKRQLNIIVR